MKLSIVDGYTDEYTEDELRESIAYIRSLESGRRWRFFPRKERYGPDVTLLSWIDHAERLLNELDRLRSDEPTDTKL